MADTMTESQEAMARAEAAAQPKQPRPIPRQSSFWDEHRNTSRVFPVAPDALPNARRALAHLHATEPALCKWIEDGHPTLTEDDHMERFGEPYGGHGRRR